MFAPRIGCYAPPPQDLSLISIPPPPPPPPADLCKLPESESANPHSLSNRHYDVFQFLRRVETKAQPALRSALRKDHARHMDIVMKTWRLTRSYVANPGAFTLEKPALYYQKELSRFVPFVGYYLAGGDDVRGDKYGAFFEAPTPDNRGKTACGAAKGAGGARGDAFSLHPLWLQYLNGQATERQQFYGPNTWQLFHTVAEVMAARDNHRKKKRTPS